MRLPIVSSVSSRDGTLGKDAKMINALGEKRGRDFYAIRRPGLDLAFTPPEAGVAQGAVCWNGNRYQVAGNILSESTPSQQVADGTAWTTQNIKASDTTYPMSVVGFNGTFFAYFMETGGGANEVIVYESATGLTGSWAETARITSPTFLVETGFTIAWNHPVVIGSWMFVRDWDARTAGLNRCAYSDDGRAWTQSTAMVAALGLRHGSGMCEHNGKIILVGDTGVASDVWQGTVDQSDGTVTWLQLTANGGFGSDKQLAVVSHAGNLFVGFSGAAGGNRDIWKSTDDGATWSEVGTNVLGFLGSIIEVALLSYNGFLWVIDSTNANPFGVYKSSDNGATWSAGLADLLGGALVGGWQRDFVVFDGTIWVHPHVISGGQFIIHRATENTLGAGNFELDGDEVPAQFATNTECADPPQLFVKKTDGAWVLDDEGVFTKITDVDYPAETVPGVVFLNRFLFVMTPCGDIYNSDLEDFFTWNPLNVIRAENEPDTGVAIAKHQNYVVALKSTTIEFFYNGNADPNESPLVLLASTTIRLGCQDGNSVQTLEGGLFFMSRTYEGMASVHHIPKDSLSPTEIADEAIQKILSLALLTTVRSWSARVAGHSLYVLNLVDDDLTLVYDHKNSLWTVFTLRTASAPKSVTSITQTSGVATALIAAHGFGDGDPVTFAGAVQAGYNITANVTVVDSGTVTYPVAAGTVSPATVPVGGTITATGTSEGHFPFAAFTFCGGKNYVQHEDTGSIYEFSTAYTDDDGVYIDTKVRTGRLDAGDPSTPKVQSQLVAVTDRISSALLVRWTDDDFQTWTKYRRAALSSDRPELRRGGNFRRRAYDLRYTDAPALRLYGVDLELNGARGTATTEG